MTLRTPTTVAVSDLAAVQGQTFASASLITASDADGGSIVAYQIYDAGTAAGAQFLLNGMALPKDWDAIDLNHLVLAKTEGPWANWFEAIPIDRAGDGFKLRWRDYATLPPAIRPRIELALICPDAD